MTRLLLNGSPRGKASNSRLILSWIQEGLKREGEAEAKIVDLAKRSELAQQRQAFLAAKDVLLIFPLYTDSMPGLVKAFLEAVADAPAEQHVGKRLSFIVQSGFPEPIHSEAIARYLARLCQRMGWVHRGTIIKPGVEGVRVMPKLFVAKTKAGFIRAGRELATDNAFSAGLIQHMAGKRRFGPLKAMAFKALTKTGVSNFYWNDMLKKHNAFDKRFDAPYGAPLVQEGRSVRP